MRKIGVNFYENMGSNSKTIMILALKKCFASLRKTAYILGIGG